MMDVDEQYAVGRRLAGRWSAASLVDMPCRTVVHDQTGKPGETTRFGYVSAASDVESLLGENATVLADDGEPLDRAALYDRLLNDEIAVFISSGDGKVGPPPPAELVTRRQRIRSDAQTMRFLLRQFALDEMAGHGGAADAVVEVIAAEWTDHLAVLIDVAMALSLGADRQRYTDRSYSARFGVLGPAAFRRLERIGVSSNPLLVID